VTNYPIARALQWVGATMCNACLTIVPERATAWRNLCGAILFDPGSHLLHLAWKVCPTDRNLPEYDNGYTQAHRLPH